MIGPKNRRPTEIDFAQWIVDVYQRSDEIDPDEEKDWNALAMGYLLARNVDPAILNWEILSSFTCGDLSRFRRAMVEIYQGLK